MLHVPDVSFYILPMYSVEGITRTQLKHARQAVETLSALDPMSLSAITDSLPLSIFGSIGLTPCG